MSLTGVTGGAMPNETASEFTMYPGNRLFIMISTGLPQLLYGELGFKRVLLRIRIDYADEMK